MIGKLKTWLIKKLGGYSKAEYENLLKPSASIVTPIRHYVYKRCRAYYTPQFIPNGPEVEEQIKNRLLWMLAKQIKDKVYFGKIAASYQYTDQYYAEIIIAVEE